MSMDTVSAATAGTHDLGGLVAHRLGFGRYGVTGDDVWGPPDDRVRSIRVLPGRRAGRELHRHRGLLRSGHLRGAAQIALAWLLARSPVMLPIPGTSSIDHPKENVGAA
jgi:hypothetical protein